MKKTVYHGSDHIIERPKYGYGKIYNDYGVGFYCTENQNMAKEWGVSADKNGYANRYEIECDGLKVLNLNMRDYTMLHWLTILLENREFDASTPLAAEAKDICYKIFILIMKRQILSLDIVLTTAIFLLQRIFINGAISYRQLSNAMRLGKLGQQFVLKSRRAFERLEFTGYEIASVQEWYKRKASRDHMARRQYFDLERNRRQRGDLYITTILDEEMKPDDPRLR